MRSTFRLNFVRGLEGDSEPHGELGLEMSLFILSSGFDRSLGPLPNKFLSLPTADRASTVQRAARPHNSGNNGAQQRKSEPLHGFARGPDAYGRENGICSGLRRLFSSSQNRGVVAANVIRHAGRSSL